MSMIKDQEEWEENSQVIHVGYRVGLRWEETEGSEAGWEGQWKGKRRKLGKQGDKY